MTDKPVPLDADTPEDFRLRLLRDQGGDYRLRVWLLPAAVVLLGLALSLDGVAFRLAACASLATFGFWLRAEIQWSGRFWFLHHAFGQGFIRPRHDMRAELLAAILDADSVWAQHGARCSEETGQALPEEGDDAGTRYSAASSASGGYREH